MKDLREEFIQNEIWQLTFGGAFQRAHVYKSKEVNAQRKKEFKTAIRAYIEQLSTLHYQNKQVSETQHIVNIFDFSLKLQRYGDILNNGKLNFGVSQKLLNLYLKYQWCLGKIEEPPHFPVDRRIQEIMNFKPIISWTQMNCEKEYIKIIRFAEKKANGLSLAQYELKMFRRSADENG
jgi:hypothetical protein